MSRKHCLKVAEDSATKDNVDNPHIIGHAAHDIVDDDGRLMLAEGTAVTATMYYKLTKRGIKLVIINSPTGPKILQLAFYEKQLLFRNPIKLPERLDPKFDKLDLTCVGNAVTCVRAILDKVSQDIFLRDNITALAHRFSEVYCHSINVCLLADIIAQKVNLSPSDRHNLGLAALFHDIGKLLLPPHIVRSPNANDEAKLYYRQHPRLGADILAAGKGLNAVAVVVLQHHEYFGGQGYPEGLKEAAIHPHAHIICVANVFDRITSTCFRQDALSPAEAVEYIVNRKGTGFHPVVVDRFLETFKTGS